MNITVEAPSGPRTGVVPFDGITSEVSLLKCLALTLAIERQLGVEDVTFTVDISRANPERLIAIAKLFSQMQSEAEAMTEFVADSSKANPRSTSVLAETRRAKQLLDALEHHIAQGRSPILGYKAAASLIGWNAAICLPVGQICSRLDLAAFNADLPMLALNWIRKPDGQINHKAFPPHWAVFNQESIAQMVSHKWSPAHFDLLRTHLHALPSDVGAVKLWAAHEADPHAVGWERQAGEVSRHQMN